MVTICLKAPRADATLLSMRRYTEAEFRHALHDAEVPEGQTQRALSCLRRQPAEQVQFEAAHMAYYLGALLTIGSRSTAGWNP